MEQAEQVSAAIHRLLVASESGHLTVEFGEAVKAIVDAIPIEQADRLGAVYVTLLQLCGAMIEATGGEPVTAVPVAGTPLGPVPLDQCPDPTARWVGRFIAAGLNGDGDTAAALWTASASMSPDEARAASKQLSQCWMIPLAVVPRFVAAGNPLTSEILASRGMHP